jgi:hypothetical protein
MLRNTFGNVKRSSPFFDLDAKGRINGLRIALSNCWPVRPGRDPPASNRSTLRLAGGDNLVVGGKPAGLFLREFQATVDGNLEHAAHPGDELDLGTILFLQQCSRTESARLIVSRLAPIDLHFHCRLLRMTVCRSTVLQAETGIYVASGGALRASPKARRATVATSARTTSNPIGMCVGPASCVELRRTR